MNEDEKYQLFCRAYDMTGHGLSDYLQDFFNDDSIRATQHGEEVYYRADTGTLTIFSAWGDWRHEIAHYFDDFLAEWQGMFGSVNEEEFMEVLAFKVARILGIFDKIPGEPMNVPEREGDFMFW